jgi:hypothetical protein
MLIRCWPGPIAVNSARSCVAKVLFLDARELAYCCSRRVEIDEQLRDGFVAHAGATVGRLFPGIGETVISFAASLETHQVEEQEQRC